MKFNFMKSKIFVVLSILLFVEILFCITGCKDLLISQTAAKTSININLDLSKLIKTSRNQTSQEVTEYLLKIEAYNAENYQENAEVENLPLLTQAKSKVDVSGLVKVTLEVPIDSNVILVAKLHKIIDENTESEKPLYKGKSEIFKVKESDNKIHLVLTKTNSDLDIDISLNTQSTYKVEHYQQNIEDDSYTLVESDSENKTGTIGTDTVAVAKSYEGFSVNPFEQKPILVDGSTTVKIYYTRNVYTVIFNANGGSLKDDASQKVKYGETPAEPTPPEKEGYNFGYWYTSKDNGVTEDVSYNFLTPVTNDVTLYAMWIAGSDIVYKVEHYKQNIEDDNYTLVESDSENKTGTIGTNTEAVAKSYEGFSVNPFDQKTILSNGSTTVKIYYTRNVFTVTFNTNGGILSESNSQLIKFKGKSTEPTEPTKEGHLFQGWYTSEDYGATFNDTTYDFEKEITENITLHAKWWNSSSFVYVEGASINGAITAEGYKESEIFKEGGIVSIPNFYISDHEVTQAEYKAIMGTWPDESVVDVEQIGVGDNYPVYYVNWFDTLVYCNKRSINEGFTPCYTIDGSTDPDDWGEVPTSPDDDNLKAWFNATCDFQADGYRLPTDAEWEYAARGGNGLTGFQYKYAGSNSIDMVAWCSDNSSGTSHEVKLKQPNDLGLYDMSGNLWEWCWDDSASDNLINYRKNRGGNWYDGSDGCMLSYRNNYYSYERMSNIGFRIVQTATAQSQGDVYSQGISLNGKIYDKTSEVVVVPSGTVSQIAMTDNGSWSSYCKDEDTRNQGVFLKDRKVQLSPFAMSQFEVTQELYKTVIGLNPSNFQTGVADSEVQELRPVECITWYDAVNFCNELTKLTMGENHCVYTITSISYDETNSYITDATVSLDLLKKGYRLPTEAEWEFAARGGDPESDVWEYAYAGVQTSKTPENFTEEPYNDNNLENYAWYNNNSNNKTHEVGKKLPNTLGIYDMNGNVDELCYDWYDIVYTENDLIINPEGPSSGENRIKRGGDYNSIGSYGSCVSGRYDILPNDRPYPYSCGFRLVRTITE